MKTKAMLIRLSLFVLGVFGLVFLAVHVAQAGHGDQSGDSNPFTSKILSNMDTNLKQAIDVIEPIFLPMVMKNYSIQETGKIVFVSYLNANGDIFVMNYDGSATTRLTNDPGSDNNPDWSPDGSKIAFTSDRKGNFDIYEMDANGSNQEQITTLGNCFGPQWSPDGSRIVFWHITTSGSTIMTMNPDGTGLYQVTNPMIGANLPYWSPDGLKIAFLGDSPVFGIYSVDKNGGSPELLYASSGIGSFAWSPDGKDLAITIGMAPNYNFDIYLYNLTSASLTRLTNTTRNHLTVDWSPEGHYLVYGSNPNDLANFDIFSMYIDGSYITNLTNSPASDNAPDWTK
jgi:Tol biopolymer transport system component